MRVGLLLQQLPEGGLWRVCEADGRPVSHWLPWEQPEGALDLGGFHDYTDAASFAAGVNLIRAEAGLLSGQSARDIEAERAALDRDRGRPPPIPKDPPLFEAA
jgi:hypothetical protein